MGPRHEDRGERDRQRSASPESERRLQWGHGTKTVENSRHLATKLVPRTWSFNGATARRPWRTPLFGRPVAQASIRSFNGATARRPWRTHAGRCPKTQEEASMGPRHEDRGEPVGENPGELNDSAPKVPKLQWGHGTKTVENLNGFAIRLSPTSWASMGPRHEDRGELSDSTPWAIDAGLRSK